MRDPLARIVIEYSRCKFIANDSCHSWPAHIDFAPVVMGCPVNCSRTDLRLEDGRHRLGFIFQAALHPSELRSIQRRHLHHRQMDFAPIMNKFAAQ